LEEWQERRSRGPGPPRDEIDGFRNPQVKKPAAACNFPHAQTPGKERVSMMKRITLFECLSGFFAFAFLFAGCGGSTHKVNLFYTNSAVDKEGLQGRKLYVSPLCSTVTFVSNSSELMKDEKQIAIIARDSLIAAFNQDFPRSLDKRLHYVEIVKKEPAYPDYNKSLNYGTMAETLEKLGADQLYFKFPDPKILAGLGVETDLILFVSSINVTIQDVEEGGGGGGGFVTNGVTFGASGPTANTTFAVGGGGGVKKVTRMKTIAKFIVRDYARNRTVACGQFQLNGGLDEDDIRGTWKKLQERVTAEIASSSGRLSD
jgi:hypothetical protein